eukprot:scaffold57995_cov28-Tisochrysis_lutea.AAC.5
MQAGSIRRRGPRHAVPEVVAARQQGSARALSAKRRAAAREARGLARRYRYYCSSPSLRADQSARARRPTPAPTGHAPPRPPPRPHGGSCR